MRHARPGGDRLRRRCTGADARRGDRALARRLRKPPASFVPPPGDLWIFAYGSLMWDPGFKYLRCAPALLRGYHRAFCVNSTRWRGTPQRPGLVLGLDRGGACRGVAFLVARSRVRRVIEDLWEREMSRFVYRARLLPIEVEARKARALAFVADPSHEGYVGRLALHDVAERIATCRGARGPNLHYLENTLRHLEALGIRERRLHQILSAVQARK